MVLSSSSIISALITLKNKTIFFIAGVKNGKPGRNGTQIIRISRMSRILYRIDQLNGEFIFFQLIRVNPENPCHLRSITHSIIRPGAINLKAQLFQPLFLWPHRRYHTGQ